jgi:hypothetical protein
MIESAPEDYLPQPHVIRACKNAECRTPIFLALEDGDPFQSVARLAKDVGSTVWKVEMGSPQNEQNALDYVDVGIQNGDWVYVTNNEYASQEVLRKIAVTLVALQPEPKRFPRREHFRIFFTVEKPFDINDNINLPFPRLLVQNGILARRRPADGGSPTKWSKKLPEESELLYKEVHKHRVRRDGGRDSDSESDAEEPSEKLTGLWFHRAVDFFSADEGTASIKPQDEIFEVVHTQNVERLRELAQSGKVDINKVTRFGMTPLQTAVSNELPLAVRVLLEAGADPNVAREADGCPPLFMSIETEDILHALLEYGADLFTKFENDRIENHPSTAPHIAKLVKKIKAESQCQQVVPEPDALSEVPPASEALNTE